MLAAIYQNVTHSKSSELMVIYQYLSLLSHDERYSMVIDGVRQMQKNIIKKIPFITDVIDKTNAGGLHMVRFLVDPMTNKVIVEIPEEPMVSLVGQDITTQGAKGGRNPTVLHAIELFTAAFKGINYPFPELLFSLSKQGYIFEIAGLHCEQIQAKILMPLTVDPPNTNVMIFHTQVPHINPEQLARAWYEVFKHDLKLDLDPIRHTILVMPVSSTPERKNSLFQQDQPSTKKQVYVEVVPKEKIEDRSRFRVMHLGRISRWEELKLNKDKSMCIIKQVNNRKVIHLID